MPSSRLRYKIAKNIWIQIVFLTQVLREVTCSEGRDVAWFYLFIFHQVFFIRMPHKSFQSCFLRCLHVRRYRVQASPEWPLHSYREHPKIHPLSPERHKMLAQGPGGTRLACGDPTRSGRPGARFPAAVPNTRSPVSFSWGTWVACDEASTNGERKETRACYQDGRRLR